MVTLLNNSVKNLLKKKLNVSKIFCFPKIPGKTLLLLYDWHGNYRVNIILKLINFCYHFISHING